VTSECSFISVRIFANIDYNYPSLKMRRPLKESLKARGNVKRKVQSRVRAEIVELSLKSKILVGDRVGLSIL